MKLCKFFRCCLPVPEKDCGNDIESSRIKKDSNRKKKKGERANPSGKRLREEAKRQKKEMADRRRKEVEIWPCLPEEVVSEVQEVSITDIPPAEEEIAGERVEGLKNGQTIIQRAMVNASQDSPNVNAMGMSLDNARADSGKKEAQTVSPPTLEEEEERPPGWLWMQGAEKEADSLFSAIKSESAERKSSCKYHTISIAPLLNIKLSSSLG